MDKKLPQTDFLATAEVASELGVSIRRIQILLNAGAFIGAKKFGRDWMIPRSSIDGVKVYGKAGRPEGSKNKAPGKKPKKGEPHAQ